MDGNRARASAVWLLGLSLLFSGCGVVPGEADPASTPAPTSGSTPTPTPPPSSSPSSSLSPSPSPAPQPTPTPAPTPAPTPQFSRLMWEAGEGGSPVEFFRVYLSSDASPSSFQAVGETPDTLVMLADLLLTVGNSYFTYVTAVGVNGVESEPSSTISFKY